MLPCNYRMLAECFVRRYHKLNSAMFGIFRQKSPSFWCLGLLTPYSESINPFPPTFISPHDPVVVQLLYNCCTIVVQLRACDVTTRSCCCPPKLQFYVCIAKIHLQNNEPPTILLLPVQTSMLRLHHRPLLHSCGLQCWHHFRHPRLSASTPLPHNPPPFLDAKTR